MVLRNSLKEVAGGFFIVTEIGRCIQLGDVGLMPLPKVAFV